MGHVAALCDPAPTSESHSIADVGGTSVKISAISLALVGAVIVMPQGASAQMAASDCLSLSRAEYAGNYCTITWVNTCNTPVLCQVYGVWQTWRPGKGEIVSIAGNCPPQVPRPRYNPAH